MNVWMKRGLQTALFTGGLLAAGTGLASADDSAVAVTAPVTVTDNALALLGTAPGDTPAEIRLPALSGTLAADLGSVAVAVPVSIGGNATDVGGLNVAQPPAEPPSGGSTGSAVDADVPVTVTGNAVAVLGTATADGGASGGPSAGSGGGTASLLDVDAPVLVCGNALGVLGDASADCTASALQSGADAPGTGVGIDAPITVCGTAVGVLGDASATCTGPATPGTQVPTSGLPGASPGMVPTGAPVSFRDGLSDGGTVFGRTAGTDGTLAYTGTAIIWALLGGLLAFALGLGLTVLSRRRADGLC
ncbi:hypothetical protein [Blastococcus atacamensis]|uniref:hypothetical protein n=1 Tax=Blastococcus atacamensis TaxID=2070508 RepID=UPI000CEB8C6E|nr:hypothetical protein [Blastococcus atacamensis]